MAESRGVLSTLDGRRNGVELIESRRKWIELVADVGDCCVLYIYRKGKLY